MVDHIAQTPPAATVVFMPFEARHHGTCDRCGRGFGPGVEITTMTPPHVLRPRYWHRQCPPYALAGVPLRDPALDRLAERLDAVAHLPLRLTGYAAGQPFEVVVSGPTVSLLRFTGRGLAVGTVEQVEPIPDAPGDRRTA